MNSTICKFKCRAKRREVLQPLFFNIKKQESEVKDMTVAGYCFLGVAVIVLCVYIYGRVKYRLTKPKDIVKEARKGFKK